jgi:hypothetical protein
MNPYRLVLSAACGLLASVASPPSTAAELPAKAGEPYALSWRQTDTSLALLNGKAVVWQFNYDKGEAKPYFHPLSSLDGNALTWLHPEDHPWHRALWFSWKTINALNYWEEDKTTVTAVHVTAAPDFSAMIDMTLSYHPPDKEEVLCEKRLIQVSAPRKDGSYRIDWRSGFTATSADVLLDRTPIAGEPGGAGAGGYAGLSLRLAKETRGWTLADSEGRLDLAIHGTKSAWVDASGSLGGKTYGLCVFDHPSNARYPSAWYINKEMPFFSPAFLFDKPYALEKGRELSVKYRILIHSGATDKTDLDKEAKEFAKAT